MPKREIPLALPARLAAHRQTAARGSSIKAPKSTAGRRAVEDEVTMSNQQSQINRPASTPAEA